MKKTNVIALGAILGCITIGACAGGAIHQTNAKTPALLGTISQEEAEYYKTHRFELFETPSDSRYEFAKPYIASAGDLERVWDSYKGQGVKIAIIDTGISVTHPDFINEDGTSAVLPESKHIYVKGTEVLSESVSDFGPEVLMHDPDEAKFFHGTATAGVAAGRMNKDGIVGIAPEADLLIYRTELVTPAITAAIKDAALQGADVISMSLGVLGEYLPGFNESYFRDKEALEEAIGFAHDANCIVIASSGNLGGSIRQMPACLHNVIGVGALASKSDDRKASYSCTNTEEDEKDGDHNVDVMTFGTAYSPTVLLSGTKMVNSFSEYSGTSFSAPAVAGMAALWKQKNPEGTNDQFEREIVDCCVDLGTPGFDKDFGNGRVDIGRLMGSNEYEKARFSTHEYSIYQKGRPYSYCEELPLAYAAEQRQSYDWTSSNSKIVDVAGNGYIYPIAPGEAAITISGNGSFDQCLIKVLPYIDPTSITLLTPSASISIGDTFQIKAETDSSDFNEDDFSYAIEDETIAWVDEKGLVTGLRNGSTTIEVSCFDISATFELTVRGHKDAFYKKVDAPLNNYEGEYIIAAKDSDLTILDGSLVSFPSFDNATFLPGLGGDSIAYSSDIAGKTFTFSKVMGKKTYSVMTKQSTYIGSMGQLDDLVAEDTVTLNSFIDIDYEDGVTTLESRGSNLAYIENYGSRYFAFGKEKDSSSIDLFKYVEGSEERVKEIDHITASYSGGSVLLNDSLDMSKIEVKAHYTSPSYYPEEAVSGFEVSHLDSSTPGKKNVTVNYHGFTASMEIDVIEESDSPITYIEISNMPEKLPFGYDGEERIDVIAHYEHKLPSTIANPRIKSVIDTKVLGVCSYEYSTVDHGMTFSASASTKVTNKDAPQIVSEPTLGWNLVDDSSTLNSGDQIIIAASDYPYAMGGHSSDKGMGTAYISKNADLTISNPSVSVMRLTLVDGSIEGTFALCTGEGFLAPVSNTVNSLGIVDSINDESSFKITISSGKATIKSVGKYSRNTIKFDYSSSCFTCMALGGKAVSIYSYGLKEGKPNWTDFEQAKAFASYFLSLTSNGCSSRSVALLRDVWSELSKEYEYMLDSSKDSFFLSNDSVIAEARDRYALIVAKYDLEAFVLSSSGVSLFNGNEGASFSSLEESVIPMAILSIGMISMAVFFLKKKRHA